MVIHLYLIFQHLMLKISCLDKDMAYLETNQQFIGIIKIKNQIYLIYKQNNQKANSINQKLILKKKNMIINNNNIFIFKMIKLQLKEIYLKAKYI